MSLAFGAGYRANRNPSVATLARVEDDGGAATIAPDGPGAAPVITVAGGERVGLRVDWPQCSGTDPCGGAESYLYVDPASKQLVTRRESMVASWYASAGAFDEDRTGRSESDPATSATNTWTAPRRPGPVHLWIVLRDARGGVGWSSYTVSVEP